MRIDFTQLEQEQETNQLQKPILNRSLANFLQHQEKSSVQQLKIVNQERSALKFTVPYPFGVSRSLSPESIKKQMSYLKAKHILPSSTLNFIQSSLAIEIEKKCQEPKTKSYLFQSPTRPNHSLYFQNSQKICKNRSKSKSSKNSKSSAKVRELGKWTKKRAQIKAQKVDKKIKQVLRAKKQKQLQQLTLRPLLNYTMNSKVSKKVIQKRQEHFKATNTSVYQTLYNDASRYQSKREIQRVRIMEQTNQGKIKKNQKITITSTFSDRLIRSLQNSAERKKRSQNREEFDQSTGRKLFIPDTHLSKITYLSHFKSTQSIQSFSQELNPARKPHYAQQSIKLNQSNQDITTLHCSFEDISQQNIQQDYKYFYKPQPGKRLEKLAQAYANLIWQNGEIDVQHLSSAEERVLTPFIESLCQFKYRPEQSQQAFLALFKDFAGRINLFDRQILLQRLKKPIIQTQQKALISQNYIVKGKRMPSSNIKAPDHTYKFYYV